MILVNGHRNRGSHEPEIPGNPAESIWNFVKTIEFIKILKKLIGLYYISATSFDRIWLLLPDI